MEKIKNLFKWINKYKLLFISVICLTIILTMLYSYLPLFTQYVFNEVLDDKVNSTNLPKFLINIFKMGGDSKINVIIIVAISLILFQTFRALLRFLEGFLRGKLKENIAYDMRNNLYNHIMELSYDYHNNCDTGDLIQRCTSDVDTAGLFISTRLADFMDMLATIIMGSYQLFMISPYVMLVSLIIVPVNAFSSVWFFKRSNIIYDKVEKSESDMTTVIQENIYNQKVVKAFANEKYEVSKMDEKNLLYYNESVKFNRFNSLFWGISDGLVSLQFVLTILVSIILAKNNKLYFGDMTAVLSLVNMVVWPMRGLGRIVSDFSRSLVAAERIEEVLKKDSEYLINGKLKPEIKGKIEFKNVSFKFDDSDKPLLNDVSFKILPGETVALIGKTGSGKSTIMNLLTRMQEISSGKILVDDVDISLIDKKHLRKNIGMVLQDPFLYSKTIYDNIAITNTNIEEEKVYEASKIADIHNDILEFENGYKTIVGEKGSTLSGGQKQRISIARILIDDKPIIIFDDSLSAVDTNTDINIRTSLKNKTKNTTILITHRITTAKEADKIIVIEDGKISGIGTHDSLKENNNLYKSLWDIQGHLEQKFLDSIGGDE